MESTEQNIRNVLMKLARFREWPGFPREKDGVQSAARSILRLVHGRLVRDLHVCQSHDPGCCPLRGAMDVTDLDWLLETVYETRDRWPVPAELREIYSGKLIPAEDLSHYFSMT